MEALYKMKRSKTGQADRTMRARIKDTASKSSRANLLDSKRRIPLSVVQPSNQMPSETDVVKEEKPAKSRVERLQEWKKQREVAKAKQRKQEKKNPPFRPCGNKATRPAVKVSTHLSPAMKPLPTTKKCENSSISCAKVPTDAKMSSAIKKTVKNKVNMPPRSSARLAAKHQTVASVVRDTVPSSSRAMSKSQTSTQVGKNKKQGVGIATKPPAGTKGRNAVPVSKSITAKAVAPVTKKIPAKTQKIVNDGKRSTRSATSGSTTSTKSSGVAKKSTSKNGKSKNSPKNKTTNAGETIIEMVENVDEGSEDPAEPPTPTKRSYMPVHPSPLLKRQVAPVRRETMFMQPLVNDPAWIPGAFRDDGTDVSALIPDFDEAFETESFSPFRFTAAQLVQSGSAFSYSPEPQQCQFVFKPGPASKLNYDDYGTTSSATEIDSSDTGMNQETDDPPAKKRHHNSKRRSRKLEEILPMIVDNVNSDSENGSNTTNAESTEEDPTSGLDGPVYSSHEIDSSDIGSDRKVVTLRTSKRRRSSRRRSRRSAVVAVDSLDSESGSGSNSEGTPSTKSHEGESENVDKDTVDFDYFRGLHANVTAKLTQLCVDWEEKTNKLIEEVNGESGTNEGDINMEDVLGQIRTTVGQAQLLMRKKLKQYLSLVEQAQDLTVEKRANADDLQSFWDMIYFQVEDVERKFVAIERLEKNGWKEKAPTPAKKRAKKRKATKKVESDSSSSEASERLQAAREKREAQRNRLKELKMAAKRAREQDTETTEEQSCEDTQTEEEPMPVAPSPKKIRVVHTPNSGRERRRSQRLVSRSVFSPVQPSSQVNCASDVPTGCLISFSPLKL